MGTGLGNGKVERKRIAVIGTVGRIPESYSLPTRTLFEAVGQNTGNLAFQYGFAHQIDADLSFFTFSFQPREIAADFDIICVPAANFLYSGFDLGGLSQRLDDCNLPIVVVGLGAQAFQSINEVKLQSGTERLLHLFSERGKSIGVRGEYTGAVLERYGVKNFEVLGCPSNFINLDDKLGQKIADRVQRPIESISYCPTFYEYNAAFELEILTAYSDKIRYLICQDPYAAVAMARDLHDEAANDWFEQKSGFILRLSDEQRARRRKELVTFFDAAAWIEFYRGQDAILGSRIHGVNLGWQAERPSALVSYDLRTEELAATMGIPYVKANELSSITAQRHLQDLVTAAALTYDGKRGELAQRYVSFLRLNCLEPAAAVLSFAGDGLGTLRERSTAEPSTNSVASGSAAPKVWGFLEQYNRRNIAGWVASTHSKAPALQLKIDGVVFDGQVDLAERNDLGGYAWTFRFKPSENSFRQNIAKIEVLLEDGIQHIENSPVVCSVGADDAKKVLVGQNGYLFLQNDSNDVLRQISGERVLSHGELDQWHDFLRRIDAEAAQRGGMAFFLIAPNKECVLSEFLPSSIEVAEERPATQLIRLFNQLRLFNTRLIYPLELLRHSVSEETYTRGDSHWSEYGVHLVAQHLFALMQSEGVMSVSPSFSGLHFMRAFRNTDLLSKLGNSCIELQPTRKYSFRAIKTFDNATVNTGLRREFESKTPCSNQRLQLWHDSFGEWLIPYLAEAFSKLSTVWSPTIDEKELIDFQPDSIIIEKAERFLVQPAIFSAASRD